MIPAREALGRLREGNRRFVSGVVDRSFTLETDRDVPSGQAPFAVVLGCSDSRVPVEIVFDQGPGDLFVIRVAGNIAAPTQVGSVEFAADLLGTRLVVVLGHSDCGAVQATLNELERPTESCSPNLRSILDRVRPAVEPLMGGEPRMDPGTLVKRAIRANIRASAEQLRHGSPILAGLIDTRGLLVVGAEYSLDSGIVDFFDEPPNSGG